MNEIQRRRRLLMARAAAAPAPVHGTWEDLFARIADGTYATAYSVGEILPLDLGTAGVVNAQIVAFNADDKADNSGKAPVTCIAQYLANSAVKYNTSKTAVGGWKNSNIRTYVSTTLASLFPSEVKNRIVEVKKYSVSYDSNGTKTADDETDDSYWIPSEREIVGGTSQETSGPTYSTLFSTTRIKKTPNGTNHHWWLRTCASKTNPRYVSTSGTGSIYQVKDANASDVYACLGFCID